MTDQLNERAGAALDLLVQRIPKIVKRDAPEAAGAYAVAVWFEWNRGDWYRWLPILVVMQQRRLTAAARLGIDPRVAFWDPWGVPPAEWAQPWEVSFGTAAVIAGVGGDLSASPRARRVFEPLQDAWLQDTEATVGGMAFDDWFGVQLARRLDGQDWHAILDAPASGLVVFHWPEQERESGALRASVAERHHPELRALGVWPP